jgi:hypothetical protein
MPDEQCVAVALPVSPSSASLLVRKMLWAAFVTGGSRLITYSLPRRPHPPHMWTPKQTDA